MKCRNIMHLTKGIAGFPCWKCPQTKWSFALTISKYSTRNEFSEICRSAAAIFNEEWQILQFLFFYFYSKTIYSKILKKFTLLLAITMHHYKFFSNFQMRNSRLKKFQNFCMRFFRIKIHGSILIFSLNISH